MGEDWTEDTKCESSVYETAYNNQRRSADRKKEESKD